VTPLVYTVNYKHSFLGSILRDLANAINVSPEEYSGNVETQRN